MAKRQSPRLQERGPRPTRCVIYTRKSTEEGLEQEFNSLDAQREACAAYILSQRHEGWTLLPDIYDDGGYSGGNMERPALKALMHEVAAGKVDVIVVYKVDRLTRSLSDFARIVDVLDGAGASFVSVTQSFNTTTSMGRLTLNVLLSFAQFEREVTSERIRDKVAASKKRGMWMGGVVPLGYEVKERKLVIVEADADRVRHIFRRYIELKSLGALAAELEGNGIRSKRRVLGNGQIYGDRPFSRGALSTLLTNRTYIGQAVHKARNESYPGEHKAIVAPEQWEAVQALLADHRRTSKLGSRADQPSLLAGMIVDAEGRRMTPVHATKGSRRYRYYVTAPDKPNGSAPASAWRIPAGEIEQLIHQRFVSWVRDDASSDSTLTGSLQPHQALELRTRCASLAHDLHAFAPATLREQLLRLDTRVTISEDNVLVTLASAGLLEQLFDRASHEDQPRIRITVAVGLVRKGQELRLCLPSQDARSSGKPDVRLLGIIAKAEAAHRTLISGDVIDAVQRPHLTRLARLKYLAPDIVSAILDGRQPASLAARQLYRVGDLPLCWHEQRRILRFS